MATRHLNRRAPVGLAGALMLLAVGWSAAAGTTDPDLPGVTPRLELIPAGSLVIPMDTALQALGGTPFNLKAYGLVNALLQTNIPVKWAIAAGKAKDGVDFTAWARRLLPTPAPASNLAFRAGPFVVHRAFADQARPVMAGFGGAVAVYELTSNVWVDIRYTLAHKPRILVLDDGGTDEIHTRILQEAGFAPEHYMVVHAAQAQYYASNSCYTLVAAPHYKPADLQRATNEARSIRTFLEAGGNFLAQCAAVRTYENNAAFGHFCSDHGIADDNRKSRFSYPVPDLAFSQFEGELADISGNLQDWTLAPGARLANAAHVHVRNLANTNSMAAASAKLRPGHLGSVVFYLGGHDYAGSSLAEINGRRMFLNAVFVPALRPPECGFNFGTDLAVVLDDGLTVVQPGQRVVYTLVVTNAGPVTATGARLIAVPPAELQDVVWTGVVLDGAVASVPAGTGPIDQSVHLPPGGAIVFTVEATVVSAARCGVTFEAHVQPPAGLVDTEPGNNLARDQDQIPPQVQAPADLTVECAGDVPAPVTDLAQFLAQGGVVPTDCCGTPPTVAHVEDMLFEGRGCVADPTFVVRFYRLDYDCLPSVYVAQTITVQDTTPPQVVCPPNFTVQRLSRVPAPDPALVSAADNCGPVTVAFGGDRLVTNGVVIRVLRTYVATDACGLTTTCTQTITVDPNFGAPVARPDTYQVTEDVPLTVPAPGVLANDTDPDQDPLTAVLVVPPAHGTLRLEPNGQFTYIPQPDFTGEDTFSYQASDGAGTSAPVIVRLVVAPVNDPPTLDPIPDLVIWEDSGLQFVPLTGISSGAANEPDVLRVRVSHDNPDLITEVYLDYLSPDSTGILWFVPGSNAIGTVTFTVTVDDGGASNNLVSRTFTVTVLPVDFPPQLDPVPDLVIDEDAGLQAVTLTGIRTKARYRIQTVTATITSRGPAVLTSPSVDYVPPADRATLSFGTLSNAYGTVTLQVTVTDTQATNNTTSRSFTVMVNPVNDPPSFVKGPDQLVQQNAGPQRVPGWAQHISPGPDNESHQQVSFQVSTDRPDLFAQPPQISADGTLTYTPAPNAFGIAQVTAVLKDDGGTERGGVDTSPAQTFALIINAPPTVAIAQPTNGTIFIAPGTIRFVVQASDPDDRVSQVRLWQADQLVASWDQPPYVTVVSNVPAGQYEFVAEAIDTRGGRSLSVPVRVTVVTGPTLTVLSPLVFNPQTGLFEQKVRVSNPTPEPLSAVRVLIHNLPAKQQVYNASGYFNGVPYVQANRPLAPGASVDLLIEYYTPDRLPEEPTLTAAVTVPASNPTPQGSGQPVSRALKLSNGTFLIEFMSESNRTYYVRYSDDLVTWKTALPAVRGTGYRVQWIDNGPPRTEPGPDTVPHRYYRVIMAP